MALLTAEDVLNKAFSKTKYREGFDQDEVDDFLDEVADAISTLTAERDELQTRLAQYQDGGAPVAAAAALAPPTDLFAAATDPNPPSATTMLSMAQKIHDDYVQAGETERDRIIDEGKAKAESIVEQAETDARGRLQSLDLDRAELERRIDDLRRFERDYRGHLRNYLENLLGDLEHNSARGGAVAVGDAAPLVTDAPLVTAAPLVTDAPLVPAAPAPASDGFAPYEAVVPYEAVATYEAVAPQETFVEPAVDHAADAQEPFYTAGSPQSIELAETPIIQGWGPEVTQAAVPQPLPEDLPPFPGTLRAASTFQSPFKDVNPFAPAVEPAHLETPATQPTEPATPTLPNPDEEAPRWNF